MICNFARQIHNCVLQHVSLIRKICVMSNKLHPLFVLNRYIEVRSKLSREDHLT